MWSGSYPEHLTSHLWTEVFWAHAHILLFRIRESDRCTRVITYAWMGRHTFMVSNFL